MKERRVHPRYAVGIDCQLVHGGTTLTARTNDISRGGISFNVPTPIEMSSVVELRMALVFPDNAFSESIHLKGVVVWCTRLGDHYQVGAKFELLTAENRRYLDLFMTFLEGDLDDEVDDNDPSARSSEP